MYKCEDCGRVFNEPTTYTDDCTPGGAFDGGSFNRKYKGCPLCSGNYFEYIEQDEEIEE